ncbi:MAG: hypothetical protein EBR82_26595 [Caulobacteraceae bacterium]|nr:hypothetical protein [Caulobacteraceae bacterium]
MDIYSVSLSTDSVTFIVSVDYEYEDKGGDYDEIDEDKLYDLAIARIKNEEGIDLGNRRLDFTWELI